MKGRLLFILALGASWAAVLWMATASDKGFVSNLPLPLATWYAIGPLALPPVGFYLLFLEFRVQRKGTLGMILLFILSTLPLAAAAWLQLSSRHA